MSTSNLQLDYSDAPTSAAAAETNPSWVTFTYQNFIVNIDKAVCNSYSIDTTVETTISDSIYLYYTIDSANGPATISLALQKFYIVKNNTIYTMIINGVSLEPNNVKVIYYDTPILTNSKYYKNYGKFISTYTQDKEEFVAYENTYREIYDIQASCNSASTGTIQYKIYIDSNIIGSITFSPGQNTGSYTLNNFIVSPGSRLYIKSPNVSDATLGGIGINILLR